MSYGGALAGGSGWQGRYPLTNSAPGLTTTVRFHAGDKAISIERSPTGPFGASQAFSSQQQLQQQLGKNVNVHSRMSGKEVGSQHQSLYSNSSITTSKGAKERSKSASSGIKGSFASASKAESPANHKGAGDHPTHHTAHTAASATATTAAGNASSSSSFCSTSQSLRPHGIPPHIFMTPADLQRRAAERSWAATSGGGGGKNYQAHDPAHPATAGLTTGGLHLLQVPAEDAIRPAEGGGAAGAARGLNGYATFPHFHNRSPESNSENAKGSSSPLSQIAGKGGKKGPKDRQLSAGSWTSSGEIKGGSGTRVRTAAVDKAGATTAGK